MAAKGKENTARTGGRKSLSEAEKEARKAALKNETKADKFRRLAKMRVPMALAKIKNIGNLGGSGYEYTAEQVTKIESALTERVQSVVERLKAGLERGGSSETTKETFDI